MNYLLEQKQQQPSFPGLVTERPGLFMAQGRRGKINCSTPKFGLSTPKYKFHLKKKIQRWKRKPLRYFFVGFHDPRYFLFTNFAPQPLT